jgi:hypothetical protein
MREFPGADKIKGMLSEGFLGCKKREISKLDLLKEIYNLEFQKADLLYNLKNGLEKEDFDEKQ